MSDQDNLIRFPRSGRARAGHQASAQERLAKVLAAAMPEDADDAETVVPLQMVTGNGNIQISYGGACHQVILGNWNIQINQMMEK